ncbi:MAG: hypothetical protein UX58_C0008G0017 [Candidatus Wolfebacteria bacterium GW2011_GWB2_46_69]|uniref:Uncharacterized protein n=1 Tax=Candidatus Wolfebacteria bacterium GW2011_GWA2_47_9b TaxID=1619005 RepID=A0A0G1WGD6_9BACT|nr:MAG: hypothetical protein UX58_C0008G0017 [Candidatus Wolfebacteria bacterium GW2011_GWB2_46_69]KKU58842.1 MAG: hypothetical protein UX83_C0011G0054 [Candidatus Wolfebacteria bacterium GW2011_GWE2_47_12]KKU65417.1 MAG: hypothetical protein UX90_C0006G0021 [Candidatus Wolfebacteria bacterium GW2011_GWD2_47_17]KKU89393.1 MAG: hypothetical protein UY19_C0015G0033 [Candidatus Wolfebacteria bacterium GW2011_GWA2_47_9b]
MSSPVYTCRESAEITSAPDASVCCLMKRAIETARSDFPEAVGPTTAMSFGLAVELSTIDVAYISQELYNKSIKLHRGKREAFPQEV